MRRSKPKKSRRHKRRKKSIRRNNKPVLDYKVSCKYSSRCNNYSCEHYHAHIPIQLSDIANCDASYYKIFCYVVKKFVYCVSIKNGKNKS